MNRERLLRLADFLVGLSPERFDLAYWYREKPCGTVACAIGWATTIPEFQAAGLGLGRHAWFWNDEEPIYFPTFRDEDSRHVYGEATVRQFFGLKDHRQFQYLFTDESYPADACGPTHVAFRIRQFVENGGVI
jgi:hypothetical protein